MASENKSPYPWKGVNEIHDLKRKSDGMDLNKGICKMQKIEFDVLIDKRESRKLDSFDLLRGFRHRNAIPLLDFYFQDKAQKFGRLVIPEVEFSFSSWFQSKGKDLLFDKMGHMTVTLEKLIIEFCDLVQSLLKRKLIINSFDMGNVFVNVFDSEPTLCILLTEVSRVSYIDDLQRDRAWDPPRKFLTWCENQCHVKRDKLTESFCNFLSKSKIDIKMLKRYPHNWDDTMKGEYLMSLVASKHSQMRSKLGNSGLKWPFLENLPHRPDSLPELLQSVLQWDKQERNAQHNTSDFFSYVILLRNCYKHYETMPEKIREILVSRKTLIEYVEIWKPGFWVEIYEILGWP